MSIRFIFVSVLFTLFGGICFSQTYNWGNVAMGGGGFVSSIITCPTQQNLIFCRTDVGGAYKWNESSKSWTPLNDWAADNETGYLGVEALAIDPTTPANVYMLVGIDYFNNGKSAILRSSDYGTSFKITEVTSQFKAHGNGMGRQNGERLAVDPNKGTILLCGTRRNGLFKSIDAGATWSNIAAFPVTTTTNDNGICFVVFDKSTGSTGNATQTIYAGVSRSGNSNLYVSTNGGSSWSAIAGQPTTYMPQRAVLASDGNLYVTYGNGAGPHGGYGTTASETMDNGQVWKYNTKTATWTNITPVISGVSMAFAGVSVDASNAQKIIVTTTNKYLQQPTYPNNTSTPWGDRIFYSVNGGSSWTDLMGSNKFAFDNNGIPWIDGHAIHWAGSIEIDPFNPSRAFVTSGNGLFMTENLSSTATSTWKFMVKGIEETVPLDMISIPSGPMVSVIGDYDGSVYANSAVTAFPKIHSPSIGTSTGIAFAALKPAYIVRLGGASDGSSISMYYSNNSGSTWTAIGAKPTSAAYQGRVCVNADGSAILWCPNSSTTTYKSVNNGTSWTSVTGLSISNAIPVADQKNANKVYAYDNSSGTVYVSTNAGTSFSAGGSAGSGGSKIIRTVPGVEGDIWVPLYSGGLARSTNSGTSFSKISNVSTCAAVGFGKIATGKTFPTIFIWGTVNGVLGLYKSTDTGVSWTRINDNNHEWGGPGNGVFVVGDMNVEGRVYMSTAGRGIVYGEPLVSLCSIPNLGADTSFCGITLPLQLNSKTVSATNVSYKWYRDGSLISGANSATYSLANISPGTYKVQRDSASCTQSDEIVVSLSLPKPNLGGDVDICETSSVTLDANVDGNSMTYSWTKDGAVIAGATSKKYSTSNAGTYVCTNNALNCASQSDTIVVSSKLLSISTDTICSAGSVTLKVLSTGGPYEWYNAASTGTLLSTGSIYTPSISANTTYYVNDAGGVDTAIGFASQNTGYSGWYTNLFSNLDCQQKVSVLKAINLKSVSVYVQTSGTNVTIRFMQGTTVAYSYTANNVSAGLQVIPVNFALVPGDYVIDAVGTTNSLFLQTNSATFPYSLNGYISFSNAESWATAYYGMFYNWVLKVGNTCARTPVTAVVDSKATKCSSGQTISLTKGWNLISFNVIPTNTAISSVFAGLGSNLQTIKTADGFYTSSQSAFMNSLTNIEVGKAYLVFVSASTSLTVNGIPTGNLSFPLKKGWNMMGYPMQSNSSINTAFSNISSQIITVKNFDGFWQPASSTNSLINLEPGKGYFINVLNDCNISW